MMETEIAAEPPGFDVHHDVPSPPPYDTRLETLQEMLQNLSFEQHVKKTIVPPTVDECLVHLKLMSAFANLRQDISTSDGLFGISDSVADLYNSAAKINALRAIREKRWQVFVTLSEYRFRAWWNALPKDQDRLETVYTLSMVEVDPYMLDSMANLAAKKGLTRDSLPPLGKQLCVALLTSDVMMVWHAFMLNPRDYLQDCFHSFHMDLWKAPFPWDAVNKSIDNISFNYDPPADAASKFEKDTGHAWDILKEPNEISVVCPRCHNNTLVTLTNADLGAPELPFPSGTGYADKNFKQPCTHCKFSIKLEALAVEKFRRDAADTYKNGTPLPGTLLSPRGLVELQTQVAGSSMYGNMWFATKLLQIPTIAASLQELTRPQDGYTTVTNLHMIREEIERFMDDPIVRKHKLPRMRKRLAVDKWSIRKMMAYYSATASPFSLDLVGAVIRQSSFVQKMDNIGWIHSPTVQSTISRVIEKYSTFMAIIGENRGKMAVPTLDVDLVWHTHQLQPLRYFTFSVVRTNGTFVDHDDKVGEAKLSDAFQWTCKQYEKLTNGGVYSECTCWYCEALRESTTGLFSSHNSLFKATVKSLHKAAGIEEGSHVQMHLSHHNVFPSTSDEERVEEEVLRSQLLRSYSKARRRAEKEGWRLPEKGTFKPVEVWGFPYPVLMPYAADPLLSLDMYAVNPLCANSTIDTQADCVAGTCSSAVSVGRCATQTGTGFVVQPLASGEPTHIGGCSGNGFGGCSTTF
ncbi:uncharacterized protein V1510DRAFT_133363 [Dipodascopsis tothii]|uniref:uncharacterized protein n=1 Tax=Dipodascopsis tothii TaxID=44089 RepID=UPI0034CFEA0A